MRLDLRRLHTDTGYYEPRPAPDEVDLGVEERDVSLEKREANAILVDRAGDMVDEPIDFVCECRAADCFAHVPLSVLDYQRLSRFGFVGGRECPESTRLVRAT